MHSMVDQTEARLGKVGGHYAIVASRWNDFVTERLVEGAKRVLEMHGVDSLDIIWVPGTWEIPSVAMAAVEKGCEGVVCVGCILQGATIHASQLSNQVAAAVSSISQRTGVPIGWGVLTCDTQEEAIERSGMKMGNKGEEAARAVLQSVSVIKQVKSK
jgi:6,7-dimethyl-8-ribityllumazine synthase